MPLSPKAKEALLGRIRPVYEEETDAHVKMFIWGDNGVGKTTFAATAPKPLLLDFEFGGLPLINDPVLAQIPRIVIRERSDVDGIYDLIRTGDLPDVETVIFDSLSEMQKENLTEILKVEHAKRQDRNQYLPMEHHYKENAERIRQTISMFRELPVNLIMISSMVEETDDDTKVTRIRPDVTPAVIGTIKRMADVVGYMTADPKKDGAIERKMQIVGTRKLPAKTRLGGLPFVVANPTFEMFAEAKRKMIEAAQAYKLEGEKK